MPSSNNIFKYLKILIIFLHKSFKSINKFKFTEKKNITHKKVCRVTR